MEETIKSFVGKSVDINCGGTAVFSGEVAEVNSQTVKLSMEDGAEVYIALDKISAVSNGHSEHHRPGFVI